MRRPAVPLEPLPVVVPVGVDVGAGRVRAGRRRRSRRRGSAWNAARSGGVTWVDFANCAMSKTSSSRGRDVPVADQGGVAVRATARPPRAAAPASRACRRSAGRRACGRWARRATRRVRRRTSPPIARDSAATGSPQPGMPVEADLDVLEADPADDRHAVPLVDAGDRDVVPEGLQAHQRQLVLAGLGLLERRARRRRGAAGTPRRGRCGSGGS